jgi:hypothetical protein
MLGGSISCSIPLSSLCSVYLLSQKHSSVQIPSTYFSTSFLSFLEHRSSHLTFSNPLAMHGISLHNVPDLWQCMVSLYKMFQISGNAWHLFTNIPYLWQCVAFRPRSYKTVLRILPEDETRFTQLIMPRFSSLHYARI